MSRKYKFNDKNGVYFISFATVYWIDVFVRDCYFEMMISALNYCRENKGMKIYGYCIMPSHVHLLFQIEEKNPSDVIRDLKTFTSSTTETNCRISSGKPQRMATMDVPVSCEKV